MAAAGVLCPGTARAYDERSEAQMCLSAAIASHPPAFSGL